MEKGKYFPKKAKSHLIYEHPLYTETLCGRRLPKVRLVTKNKELVTCQECLNRKKRLQ